MLHLLPDQSNCQVFVAGGSLVGLSAALFLSSRGVDTVLVEKHTSSSPHPRAVGFTELTMEHYRAVGIEDRIPQVAAGTRLRRMRVESLSGQWYEEQSWTPGEDLAHREGSSPCTGAAIAQDRLEPILRAAAAERGAKLLLGAEVVDFHEDADGVRIRVRDRKAGIERAFFADYMIAADGADSFVRERLEVKRRGVGHIRTMRSVLFRCDQAEPYLAQGVQQFSVEQADFRAFLTHYPDGRWVLMFGDDVERSDQELGTAIRRALGKDMPFEVIGTGRWEMAGRIAERYSVGRIFLAGDAAHQLPPTRGGFGANTGIDDVYNLAWKLQMVLAGQANPSLLETYDAERRPIGWLRHQQTFARPDYRRWVGEALADEPLYGDVAMELGQRVSSSAVIAPEPPISLPPAADPEFWAGMPGTRVPHAWITTGGRRASTTDLFTETLTLISADADWIAVGRAAAESSRVPLQLLVVGQDVVFPVERTFETVFGVGPGGASLVRPDAVVAWRSLGRPAAGEHDLVETIARLLAKKG
ncbi:FAD-dependent monooxygenase [Sphingomonas sp. BK580]|uniref:FAD-dependent monooxygenase n=1 Tax=Sphingomonas sp. BK580 TaxID=2586972 RepID=UPI00161792F1|nr:FAD-dependent monooxygenase [Sphingomonas sp. BK580]MBB3695252.1 2-polyprenyl-6-methoxyphenol hydroxylase-like FAD-dependent oxidoreductase [Sphingomonas sp. BK580]